MKPSVSPQPDAPTLLQSVLRGLACKCPHCGNGKLFEGFLTLRPRCEACGLDYTFIDTGDGPAIFIIMLAGAIVVACAINCTPAFVGLFAFTATTLTCVCFGH